MVDVNNITIAMNEMGQFFLQTLDGTNLPPALAEQRFTSERDARIGLSRYNAKHEIIKQGASKCQEQVPSDL